MTAGGAGAGRAGVPAGGKSAGETGSGRDRRFLIGAILLLLLVRAWTVASLAGNLEITEPLLDARHYLDLAQRLARGAGWPPGPIFMTPLYPAWLSLVFRVAPAGVLTVQIVQSFLGLLAGLILFRAVGRHLGSGAAWGALGLYLASGPVLAMESQVLTESLLFLLACAALWTWPDRTAGRSRPFLFGLFCGLLVIGRGSFVLLPLGWTVVSLAGTGSPGGRRLPLRNLLWIGLGLALPLAPLAIHQTRETGRPTLLTLNGGLNLYLGNNPASRGIYNLPPEVVIEADPAATRSASRMSGRPLSPVETADFWRDRALRFIREKPRRAAWLFGRKALLFLSPQEIPQIENFASLRAASLPLRLAFVGFWVLLPLSAFGLTRITAGRRFRPFLTLIGVGWLATILFFATGRYRIAVLPGFLGPAGLGLAELIGAIRAHRFSARWLLLPAILGLQGLLPGYPMARARAFTETQRGQRLIARGDLSAAATAYQRATELDPASGGAWHGLGVVHAQRGEIEAAVAAYTRAAALLPGSPVTRYNLGIVEGRRGRLEASRRWLAEAVRIDPYDPKYHQDLGVTLARLGRMEAAIAEWRAALSIDPAFEPARRALSAAGVHLAPKPR